VIMIKYQESGRFIIAETVDVVSGQSLALTMLLTSAPEEDALETLVDRLHARLQEGEGLKVLGTGFLKNPSTFRVLVRLLPVAPFKAADFPIVAAICKEVWEGATVEEEKEEKEVKR